MGAPIVGAAVAAGAAAIGSIKAIWDRWTATPLEGAAADLSDMSPAQVNVRSVSQLLSEVLTLTPAQRSAWWATTTWGNAAAALSAATAAQRSVIVSSLSPSQLGNALVYWAGNNTVLSELVAALSPAQVNGLSVSQFLSVVTTLTPTQRSAWWAATTWDNAAAALSAATATERSALVASLSPSQLGNALIYWAGNNTVLSELVAALSPAQVNGFSVSQLLNAVLALTPAQRSAWWAATTWDNAAAALSVATATERSALVASLSATQLGAALNYWAGSGTVLSELVNGLSVSQFLSVVTTLTPSQRSGWWAAATQDNAAAALSGATAAQRSVIVSSLNPSQLGAALSYWAGNSTVLSELVAALSPAQVNGLSVSQFLSVVTTLTPSQRSAWWAATTQDNAAAALSAANATERSALVTSLSASQLGTALNHWAGNNTVLSELVAALTPAQVNGLSVSQFLSVVTTLTPSQRSGWWAAATWDIAAAALSAATATERSALVASLSATQLGAALNRWASNSTVLSELVAALPPAQVNRLSVSQLLNAVLALTPAQRSAWWAATTWDNAAAALSGATAAQRSVIVSSLSPSQLGAALNHWAGNSTVLSELVAALTPAQVNGLSVSQFLSVVTTLTPSQRSGWWAAATQDNAAAALSAATAAQRSAIVSSLSQSQLGTALNHWAGNNTVLSELVAALTPAQVNGLSVSQFLSVVTTLTPSQRSGWWAAATQDNAAAALSAATATERSALVTSLSATQLETALSYWSMNSTISSELVSALAPEQRATLLVSHLQSVVSWLHSNERATWQSTLSWATGEAAGPPPIVKELFADAVMAHPPRQNVYVYSARRGNLPMNLGNRSQQLVVRVGSQPGDTSISEPESEVENEEEDGGHQVHPDNVGVGEEAGQQSDGIRWVSLGGQPVRPREEAKNEEEKKEEEKPSGVSQSGNQHQGNQSIVAIELGHQPDRHDWPYEQQIRSNEGRVRSDSGNGSRSITYVMSQGYAIPNQSDIPPRLNGSSFGWIVLQHGASVFVPTFGRQGFAYLIGLNSPEPNSAAIAVYAGLVTLQFVGMGWDLVSLVSDWGIGLAEGEDRSSESTFWTSIASRGALIIAVSASFSVAYTRSPGITSDHAATLYAFVIYAVVRDSVHLILPLRALPAEPLNMRRILIAAGIYFGIQTIVNAVMDTYPSGAGTRSVDGAPIWSGVGDLVSASANFAGEVLDYMSMMMLLYGSHFIVTVAPQPLPGEIRPRWIPTRREIVSRFFLSAGRQAVLATVVFSKIAFDTFFPRGERLTNLTYRALSYIVPAGVMGFLYGFFVGSSGARTSLTSPPQSPPTEPRIQRESRLAQPNNLALPSSHVSSDSNASISSRNVVHGPSARQNAASLLVQALGALPSNSASFESAQPGTRHDGVLTPVLFSSSHHSG